ncbi:MAG: hypothetical protein ABI597_10515 [Gammaproteobacteria bacterium]
MDIMRRAIIVALVFTSVSAFAAGDQKCSPVEMTSQNNNLILSGVDQKHQSQVYIFKNLSSHSIWLDHPVEKRSSSAGWSSYLRVGNSSALMVNRKNFSISCEVIKPGKVDTLDCAKVISVCAPNHIEILKTDKKGTYWLAENQSWDELVVALEKRGVKLK